MVLSMNSVKKKDNLIQNHKQLNNLKVQDLRVLANLNLNPLIKLPNLQLKRSLFLQPIRLFSLKLNLLLPMLISQKQTIKKKMSMRLIS